jgi:hypothetical protein
MAAYPNLFGEERQPSGDFLVIPKVSSENREYIPIGFLTPEDIITDKVFAFQGASAFQFGVLTSKMHMAWVKCVCGRLKSDYSYSNTIVYNNFPWPEKPSLKHIEAVEAAAKAVLEARLLFPGSSLADLYDPLTMPPALVKAHQKLDKAVDKAYRLQEFKSEASRLVFLFELYERYTAPLLGQPKTLKKSGKASKGS